MNVCVKSAGCGRLVLVGVLLGIGDGDGVALGDWVGPGVAVGASNGFTQALSSVSNINRILVIKA